MTNKQFLTNHPPELGDIVVCEGGERWVLVDNTDAHFGLFWRCLDRPQGTYSEQIPPILALWRVDKKVHTLPSQYSHIPGNHYGRRTGGPYIETYFDLIATNTKSESLQRIESAEKKLREAQEELRLAREASK
jgi:hypothetical protein